MDPHWYRDFFGREALELWVRATPDDQTEAEVEWLGQALELEAPARLLDLPCGHGRHAVELAQLGHRVTGVDLSEVFLAAARERGEQANAAVEWVRGDMAALEVEGVFDGVLCMGNSFGYLDHSGNVAFVESVGARLRPGGRFALDTAMIAESILPDFQGNRWTEVEDMLLLVENRYDARSGGLESVYHFVRDGRVERREGRHQVYTLAELGRMLAAAGMTIVEACSSPDGEPFEPAAPRLLLVAEKGA